ncbi:MAG TPA: NAD-dependent deacylase [Bryobacteraceae bacterium]|jgi:NAD-dependent deacetylase
MQQVEQVRRARALILGARKIAVLTGAGISAESGVPTFRGAAGLWKQFRPEDLATPEAFARDPKFVWEWYAWRRQILSRVKPNAGHGALADLEQRMPDVTVITQNVDGLHQLAGTKRILEVHGSIWNLRCTVCGSEWVDRTVPLAVPPACGCGGLARPGVVWFGESLPCDVWAAAENAVLRCDVLLVVGTSALVYPAAGLVPRACSAGASVIEVNVEATPISAGVDYALTGPSGEILPDLLVASD